jgi:DNA-binding NtrC family response regulator
MVSFFITGGWLHGHYCTGELSMINLLLVSADKDSLSGLASSFNKDKNIATSWAESGNRALDMVSDVTYELVITDESLGDMSGLEFAKKLVKKNPMINLIAVSSLSPEDFHEASEGLGVLMQLPVQPGEKDAQDLLKYLKNILNITNKSQ